MKEGTKNGDPPSSANSGLRRVNRRRRQETEQRTRRQEEGEWEEGKGKRKGRREKRWKGNRRPDKGYGRQETAAGNRKTVSGYRFPNQSATLALWRVNQSLSQALRYRFASRVGPEFLVDLADTTTNAIDGNVQLLGDSGI